MTAVDEQVTGRGARAEEGAPPPVVVLGAQVEVAQQDRRLRTRDHQDHEDQEQEAEHIVHLARPQGVEYEEQLYKDATEGQNSSHDDAGYRLRVQGLLGDLPRDLVGAHWMVQDPLSEAEVGPDERQRHRHSKPQGEQRHQRRERHRGRRVLTPQHQVHHEEQRENNAGTDSGSE